MGWSVPSHLSLSLNIDILHYIYSEDISYLVWNVDVDIAIYCMERRILKKGGVGEIPNPLGLKNS